MLGPEIETHAACPGPGQRALQLVGAKPGMECIASEKLERLAKGLYGMRGSLGEPAGRANEGGRAEKVAGQERISSRSSSGVTVQMSRAPFR